MQRIIIVGPSGAGKSTLARNLGEKLDLPVFHLDQLFFKPEWVPKEPGDFLKEIDEILDKNEQWIIEGNYGKTLPIRLEKSTSVLYLDFPRYVYVWRVAKRIITDYGKVRVDAAPGCSERIDLEFFKWVWTFPKRRESLKKILEIHAPGKVNVFKHPKELEVFLKKA